jgi:hypothetical protein
MCSVEIQGDFVYGLHIPVRCVLYRFLVLRYHCRNLCLLRLGIESITISIPEEPIESKRFGKSGDYLCLTDVLCSRSNDAVSATGDGGRN